MKYVMRALVTGKHSFGRKVLHFVTVVAAFGMFLPVLVCCTLTSQKKNKPLFAVLFLLDLSFYSSFFNVLLKLGIAGFMVYFIAIRAGILKKGDDE